jgi:hypothetical protein
MQNPIITNLTYFRELRSNLYRREESVTILKRTVTSMPRYEYIDVEVNLRPTVSRPVCLGVRRPSGTRDQFFFLLEISFRQLRVYYFVAPSLTRRRVCNLPYNCFWALPEQSLLGRSPAELTALFYCLIWDPPTWRARSPYLYPPGTGWPSYTPGHWVPILSPLTTRRATVEVYRHCKGKRQSCPCA